jgi:integrase
MPRKRELTWFKPRKCWKKYCDGKVYYLGNGRCRGKTDDDGYQVALAEWETLKQQLQVGPTGVDPRKSVAMATDYKSLGISFDGSSTDPASGEKRISALVDAYLSKRRLEAESGQISVKMFDEHRCKILDFARVAAENGLTEIDEVTSKFLDWYRDAQLAVISEGEISPVTAKKRLSRLKTFLEWCYSSEYLDQLPRCLVNGFTKVDIPDPKPQFFTVDEVRNLFVAAPTSRTKLYICLACNFGWTQTDISSLTHEMIDWDEQTVTRKRSKTGIPTKHKFWKITADLLLGHMTPKSEGLVLVGENGLPLLTKKINDKGQESGTDVIRLAFNRVRKKLVPEEKRGFAVFRKTSGDFVKEEFQSEPHLFDQFLGHAPHNKMEKHYSKLHRDRLFDAIKFLEELYDLETVAG